ncbi:MAG: class I SAM-dependent methyltransferase [Christensenellales bacterium]|jgi:16S rRNA (guanine1207-N2)-methyltransferase
MAEHYYSEAPSSAHAPRAFEVHCAGLRLSFETDAGVFSKDALDFGSRLLIETAPPVSGRALDLGCGWGAIGIFLAAKNPGARFTLSDINERAVSLARKNIARNGIQNAVAVESDGYASLDGQFDAIFSNPPIRAGKQTIYRLFDEGKERLLPGGALYLVIRKQQGAESALRHLEEVYGNAEILEKAKGFWILSCKKREENIEP